MRRRAPRLLAISDRSLLGSRPFADWVAELAAAEVDALQIREKDLDDRALAELAEEACRAARGMTVLVNGRADVAIAAGCHGVHLPSDGVPAAALRERFGDRLVIGCSTHRPEEAAAAARAGADYVTFGPVYRTPSKQRYGDPPGLEGLRRAAGSDLPVVALGGVDAGRLAEVAAAGAAGAAGIRAFHDPRSLARMAAAARRAWPPSASAARCG